MPDIPLVVGYRLEAALKLLGEGHRITIEATSTPYKDKISERQGNEPVVVRQTTAGDEIKLTTSLFK